MSDEERVDRLLSVLCPLAERAARVLAARALVEVITSSADASSSD